MRLRQNTRRAGSRHSSREQRLLLEQLEQRVVLNAAPVLDPTASPALDAVLEDAGAPVGQVGTPVTALIDAGGPLNNFSDADGDSPGIAITGVNLQGGTLWYSVNGGVTWSDVGEVSDAEPRLLAANSLNRVYYQPAPDFAGTITDVTTFKAWDQYGELDQLGSNIDSIVFYDKDTMQFGCPVSLSADGRTVAIGIPYKTDDLPQHFRTPGQVRLYRWSGTSWEQLGNYIDGEQRGDLAGFSVSLSDDGNTVAIGIPLGASVPTNPTKPHGRVRIYEWSGTAWDQVGDDIDGEAAGDEAGTSVSLSADGNTVAIGAPMHKGSNGYFSGHTRIYQRSGASWKQVGENIDGAAAGDRSGWSVSLSADGNTIAIGAGLHSNRDIRNCGHVRMYRWSGASWEQVGVDIDGEATADYSGYSVSLSADGNTVAIGAPGHDNGTGNVRLYFWSGTAWEQLGNDIDGKFSEGSFGSSVSLSHDGNTVAIGAPAQIFTRFDKGHVRLYRLLGASWEQFGGDIEGEARYDHSGWSVSLSADGDKVAIGAPQLYRNRRSPGNVRAFHFSPHPTSFSTGTDAISVNVIPVVNVPSGETRTEDNTYSGETTLVKTGGGTLVLNKANAHTGGLRVEEGTVILQHVDALNGGPLVVNAGARVLIDTGTSLVPLSSLSLDAAANLDVGEGGFTVSNGGFSEADVRQALIEGRNGGAWDAAAGITHSSTAASRAVGYRVDAAGALTARQTLAGDVDLDGDVDFDDILGLFPNYGTATGMVWYGGDITYDDAVNFDDILALFPNYGNGGAFGASGAGLGGGRGGTGLLSTFGGGSGSGSSTIDTTTVVMGPEPPSDLPRGTVTTLTRSDESGSISGLDATSLAFAGLVQQTGDGKKKGDTGVTVGLAG